MFVQVISGTVTDRDGFLDRAGKWRDEIRPGAIGYLGSTGGVADDGTFIIFARFDSPDAAAANSNRPEQGAWWADTEQYVADVRFEESTDVTLQDAGGSDDAGFVQVMAGHITDAPRYDKMMGRLPEFIATMKEVRPDILGGVTVRLDDDRYYDIIYFQSESTARAAESMELPDAAKAEMEEMMAAAEVDRFIDLKQPLLW